jgi:hypothetical protein
MAPTIEEPGLRASVTAALPQDLIGRENIGDLITRAMATAHRSEHDHQENDPALPQDRVGWIIEIMRGLDLHDRGQNRQRQPPQLENIQNDDQNRMDGGRKTKQSKKRSTTRRRRRSSKARNARKSRKVRKSRATRRR